MKEQLVEFCKSIGIEYVGIASSNPYIDLRDILQNRIEVEFLEQTIREYKNLERKIAALEKQLLDVITKSPSTCKHQTNIEKTSEGVEVKKRSIFEKIDFNKQEEPCKLPTKDFLKGANFRTDKIHNGKNLLIRTWSKN